MAMFSRFFGVLFLLSFKIGAHAGLLSQPQQQPLNGEDLNASFTADFDAFVEDLLQYWHVPGLSLAVIEGDKVYSKVTLSISVTCQVQEAEDYKGLWIRQSSGRQSNIRHSILHWQHNESFYRSCNCFHDP